MLLDAIRTAVLGEGYRLAATPTFSIGCLPGLFTERWSYLETIVVMTGSLRAFHLYLEYRQLHHDCDHTIPAEVLELEILKPGDEEKYKSTQEYQAEKRVFGIGCGLWSGFNEIVGSVLQPLVYTTLRHSAIVGASSALASRCDEAGASYDLVFFLVYDFAVKWIQKPIDIAISAYVTFSIEERHGFNKTTPSTFVKDLVLEELVSLPINALVEGAFHVILSRMGRSSVFYMWGFVQVMQVFMLWFYPNYIQPLFNTYKELEEGPLKEQIQSLADRVEYPLYKLFVMDASKRSSHSNAYMFGFWKWKRIVLFDTLMKQPQEELLAILGHELGHWKLGHTATMTCCMSGLVAAVFGIIGQLMFNPAVAADLSASFGYGAAATSDTLLRMQLTLAVVTGPVFLTFKRIMTLQSRRHEFQADGFAVDLGYGAPLSSGLKTLTTENKGSLNNDWLWAWWHRSHPTTSERLVAIREKMKKTE
eukprot:TRINITY_DN6161_c0_g1_i1.p1 TRINITY_DN6161_c0_g1~~TRINITY_DN6161_c0_g1_i1.p1  ORF type:complete len:499 (+),score=222.14 TRINITY_DN6161_c0_g1_i1:68-1498(+)